LRFLKRRLDTPARPAGWPIPQWYYLDIGNVCNLRCPYCPTGNGATPESQKGLMSRESFDRILPQLEKHARFVCLFNWGEPWVNKHLLYMVRALADRGIDTHLDSNLSVRDFSDRDAEAVVRSGLFSLFASIDGVSQAAYEKYRVGGRVDRALGNLRQLAEARRRLGSETPGLIWAFYLNRHNEHEIDEARALAEEIGVEIWFKLLSAPEEFQTRFAREQGPVLAVPASLRRWHPNPVAPGLESLQLHPLLASVCRQPFTVGVIQWNGDVFPCCAVAGDEFKLGNVLEQTFEEVWNDAPLSACRSFLKNFGPVQGGGSVCEVVCTAVPSHA
jgi:MoaA/NifB/PqqE/SkfB family radical SAM enzyme